MPLSEDQKAMLRLLAQRGEQGYEDIAALKGVGVDDVRAQAQEAVRQLEAEGLPPPALPLQRPDAATPSPEPEEPAASPDPPSPPPPSPPPVPPQREPVRSAAAPKKEPSRWRPSSISMPGNPVARAAIAAVAAAAVIVVAILLIGGDGDAGGGGGGSAGADRGGGAATRNAANNKEVTKAVLRPVGGGGASGVAIFGRVNNKLALQVQAEGLEPTGSGDSYTIWLAQNPRRMLPLAFTPVEKNGRIGASFEVPVEVLAYLANETFRKLVITRTENARLTAALKKATDEKRAPSYVGERVLEGAVTGPIVGAAKEIEAQEGEEQGG